MEKSKVILAITRALQLLCAAVVFGTSVSLAEFLPKLQDLCNSTEKDKYCNLQGLIHAVQFGCFVGAVGLIDAIAGMVSVFLETLVPFIIMLGMDALACVSYLAGGLSIAIILSKAYFDQWGGSRYTQVKADDAFQFLGFIITLVIIILTFLWRRSGKMSSSV
ncbi:hypothetical protein LTR37_001518 [Vermiconidia calcicola]|uniref:Uncharacterized protein n=1 Tax=Vermiconidia calcicola TaxID=1690605 RepID=A0ACC3NUZ1_9PEZI|nr:hypothetical protein LTR37_001518 [Vermiconidia calcicola]